MRGSLESTLDEKGCLVRDILNVLLLSKYSLSAFEVPGPG